MGPVDEVLDCLTAGVVGVDYDERVGLYNAGAAHTLGIPAHEIVGRPLRDLVDAPQPVGAVARIILAAGLNGRTPRREARVEIQTPEGPRTIGYRLHVAGDTWLALMVFDDLTEALALERRAAEDRAVGDIGRMASTITHDLKSPLATISLYARLAHDEIGADHRARERLEVIQD
jgi:nitrogen fixation/metabolism regulation signal transduction histidine kinase